MGVQVGLDEAGAGPGCAVLNQGGELIVGRDEAFYFNTLEGRGPCFACEGCLPCAFITLLTCCALAAHMLPGNALGMLCPCFVNC